MGNLTDRGTLRGSLKANTTDYNALINKPAINGHTLVGNQSGHELDLANLEDVINVEANPEGASSGDLNRILIGTNIYEIPGAVVYGEASGAIASFDDGGDNKPLKSLKLSINPVQASGTPTPENPIPIYGWNGANITVDGSCFDTLTPLYNASEYNQYFNKATIQLDANTDYYINSNAPSGYNTGGALMETTFIICPNEDSPTTTNYGIIQNVEKKITTKSSGILAIYYRKAISSLSTIPITSPDQFKDGTYYLQITEKSTDGQRLGTTYPITWSEAGTVYGGKLDVTSGEGEITHVKIQGTDVTTLSMDSTTSSVTTFTFSYNANSFPKGVASTIISNRFSRSTPSGTVGRVVNTASQIYFIVSTDELTSVDAAGGKQWLIDNPTEFVYEKDVHDSFEISPTQIATLLGNNNIWSDTGDVIECIYERDLNIAINKLIAG